MSAALAVAALCACNAILGNDDAFLVAADGGVDAANEAAPTNDGTVPDAAALDGTTDGGGASDGNTDGPSDSGSRADRLDDAYVPPDAPYKRVFVTSQVYPSNLGGLAGADTQCNLLAQAAGIKENGRVTYMAWLSSTTASPSTRFQKALVPYALVDRQIVALDWVGLSKALATPIYKTENGSVASALTNACGQPPDAGVYVWTDTNVTGGPELYTSGTACGDWAGDPEAGSHSAVAGQSTAVLGEWTEQCAGPICGGTAALYCFEQ